MANTTSLTEFSIPEKYRANRKNPAVWILSHALNHWPIILLVIIGAASNGALASVTPVLIGKAFNLLSNDPHQLQELLGIAGLIVASQVGRAVLQFGRNFGSELAAQALERDIRNELYISLLGKSMTFHSLQPVGDTMSRATSDVRQINYMFSPGLNMVIGSIMFLIVPVFVAPTYHPALVLAPLLFIFAYFLSLAIYLKKLQPVTDEVRLSFGDLNSRLAEALDGIEVVKGASQETEEIELFQKNAKRYRNAAVHQGDIEATFLPYLLYGITLAGGLYHAFFLYQHGALDLGQVVGYFSLLMLLDFPTFASLFAYSQISMGLSGARRILDLINRENNLDQNKGGHSEPMKGDIEFVHASSIYEGNDESVLSDIGFHIKAGQTVAIVGQTGSGKTSLARLVNRTYDVSDGKVLVDGVDVRDWNLECLRQNISIIEQDIFLYSKTIAENIAFGKPGATQAEIEQAAKAAQADDFITDFKDGYQTIIGERGVTLSGGQRQRLALARAFLTDPRILILDDSTSAIDSETEDKIQRAIFTAARGRTTLIITHRLSQIRWADQIIVLKNGRVAATGSHDELLKTSLAYRRIFSE
jgi:ATP-binding cassette subfamily B protein